MFNMVFILVLELHCTCCMAVHWRLFTAMLLTALCCAMLCCSALCYHVLLCASDTDILTAFHSCHGLSIRQSSPVLLCCCKANHRAV